MDAPELFKASLGLIDRVARMVCGRRRLSVDETEDFVSAARLALLEDDYAVLRRYEGRSSLPAFLAVVFDHLLSDQRDHAFGRWHPSRAAERMGPAGVLLEAVVRRDKRPVDEALPLLLKLDATLTRAQLESMLAQLPERTPRPRVVPVDDLTELPAVAPERSDARTMAREARTIAHRTSDVVRRTIDTFDREDRMLIRMHFGSRLSVADISRMLRVPQRPLYRRLESRLKQLRRALEGAGLDSASILELVGAATTEMNFGLEMPMNRPSLDQEAATAGDERS
jgi:RNA polymerase sigma factor (sigma-70 family)